MGFKKSLLILTMILVLITPVWAGSSGGVVVVPPDFKDDLVLRQVCAVPKYDFIIGKPVFEVVDGVDYRVIIIKQNPIVGKPSFERIIHQLRSLLYE